MSRVLFDIRYSARKFVRTPGLTLALLFTIALGIGSNVSVYGFVRGLTQPALPLPLVDRVVSIFVRDSHGEAGPLSYLDYLSLKGHRGPFEWIGAALVSPRTMAIAGQSSIVSVAAVTPDLATLLNLSLNKGVIISHRMWQDDFGADANVRGEQIRIDGVNASISGIAPAWLEGLYRDRAVDLWMPLEEKTQQANQTNRNIWVLARLRPAVSISQTQTASELTVLPYTGMTPEMAQGLSRIGALLNTAAGVVFFIACANVFSFLLARAFARSRETSLRIALGASRTQLARELFWDSVTISVAGGTLGTLLAIWTARLIPALLFEQDAERLVFAPHLFSIVAAALTCIAITVVCGLVPLFVTSTDHPETVLRRESAGPSKALRYLSVGLVVAQMTSCCVLVISTAFLLAGLRTALETSAGHHLREPILITAQGQPESFITYFQHVEQAAQSMAGVSAIAWTGRLPASQAAWQSFRIEPPHLPLRDITLDTDWFTAGSFKRFTLPPTAGRMFGFGDQTCRVAVANQEAAAQLFDNNTPGRTIQDSSNLPVEIIGVVKEKPSPPAIYYNYLNQTGPPPQRVPRMHFRAPFRSDLASAQLDMNVVSPSYFDAMGLSLIAGQKFLPHRMPGECRVAVINQEAADLYFAGKPLGAAVIDDQGVRTSIIGVVHSKPLGTLQRHTEPAIYFPMWQDCLKRMTLIAGGRALTAPMLADLRGRIESVPEHGKAPVVIQTLAAHLSHTALAPLRIATIIIGASATTGLVLSILGLLGALSDAARQRRRELAIRVALGAQQWRVICQVLKEGARLACAGTLIGILASLALSRLLVRITPVNNSPALWVWLAAPVALAVSVLIASVLPARRALIVSPLTVLRDDN